MRSNSCTISCLPQLLPLKTSYYTPCMPSRQLSATHPLRLSQDNLPRFTRYALFSITIYMQPIHHLPFHILLHLHTLQLDGPVHLQGCVRPHLQGCLRLDLEGCLCMSPYFPQHRQTGLIHHCNPRHHLQGCRIPNPLQLARELARQLSTCPLPMQSWI